MENNLKFVSAITTEHNVPQAVQMLAKQLEGHLNKDQYDLLIVFFSPHFKDATKLLLEELKQTFSPRLLMGCTGAGIIGRDAEIEQKAAIALVAAHLPDVTMTPFSFQAEDWAEKLETPAHFREFISASDETKLFITLADPYSTPMEPVLISFNSAYSNIPIVGGLTSAPEGWNTLLLNDEIFHEGMVGLALEGAVEVDVIVSQGCRPIGEPRQVTATKENIIIELDGEPPLAYLQSLVNQLSDQDQSLLQNGLFVGRAIDSNRETLGRGDFLIRGVIGADKRSGAIAIGDILQTGETIQFHLRDAITAEEDLEMMLTPQLLYGPPSGALFFSCNGRGTRLYNHPNGDISTLKKVVGDVDLAGFFCAGEIGPIGGKNFLHGHTASLALFRSL